MKHILSILSFGELTRLIICIFLDVVEFIVPMLLTPVLGDILDIIGLLYCISAFRWIGSIAILELVPFFDPFPINILTWFIWFYFRHSPDTGLNFSQKGGKNKT